MLVGVSELVSSQRAFKNNLNQPSHFIAESPDSHSLTCFNSQRTKSYLTLTHPLSSRKFLMCQKTFLLLPSFVHHEIDFCALISQLRKPKL